MSRKLARSLLFSLASLSAAGTATAGTPILDEATARLYLVARGAEGYLPFAHVELAGTFARTDGLTLVWKAGGKPIATAACDADFDGTYAEATCEVSGKALKTTGAITADLVYRDDKAETERVVRTFRVTVKKPATDSWQIDHDSALGGAWVVHGGADEGSSGGYRRPRIYLWFSSVGYAQDLSARCTAAGKQLEDIRVSTLGGDDTGDVEVRDAKDKTHHWRKVKLAFDRYWGKKADLDESVKPGPDMMLADNPGAWECKLRKDGKTVRELRFTVSADGMIQNDEMQAGKSPVPVIPGEVFIDSRLTKDSASLDERFDPAAYKKSLQYGLAWPDHPKVKAIHAAVPRAFGPKL